APRRVLGLWYPGVSVSTTCAPSVDQIAWIPRRVVCGLSETIATFSPTRALTRVDLPTFGLPTTATTPLRKAVIAPGRPGRTRSGAGPRAPTRADRRPWSRRRRAPQVRTPRGPAGTRRTAGSDSRRR